MIQITLHHQLAVAVLLPYVFDSLLTSHQKLDSNDETAFCSFWSNKIELFRESIIVLLLLRNSSRMKANWGLPKDPFLHKENKPSKKKIALRFEIYQKPSRHKTKYLCNMSKLTIKPIESKAVKVCAFGLFNKPYCIIILHHL